MEIINRLALAVYDGSAQAPVFPTIMNAPDEFAGAYLSQTAQKLAESEGSRDGRFEENGAQAALFRAFTVSPFAEAARALLAHIEEALETLELPREGFDIAVFTFQRENDPFVCVAQLPYRRVMLHGVQIEEERVSTALRSLPCGMAQPGGKGCAGLVVNLSTGDVRVKDVPALTNVGERQLFSEALFSLQSRRSAKEAVRAVTRAIAEAAPDRQEIAPAVKRAMSRSIEEKGGIDVRDVAQEVFRSDPEREAIVEQITRQVAQEDVTPVIPVNTAENKRIAAQLEKLKIRTDSGISITLPRSLADDEDRFAVVHNDDGTLSIIIGRVQQMRTE